MEFTTKPNNMISILGALYIVSIVIALLIYSHPFIIGDKIIFDFWISHKVFRTIAGYYLFMTIAFPIIISFIIYEIIEYKEKKSK